MPEIMVRFDDLRKYCEKRLRETVPLEYINQITVEAEIVQHAYWEPSEVGEYHCTNCGAECDIDKFHKALLNLFCGKCGARMDATGTNVGKGGADNAESD